MNTITANELKTKGVSAIQENLSENHELIITVRGKEAFVIMDMEHYSYLRECELDAALHQAKIDYNDGNYIKETVDDHIKRITQ
ncbi:MAG: type II toxin-antitoxin system prevent-host-death family antitoxin [Desulfobacula sp.]|jgi:PHD/YefM family antitoxin component YafN of YafNO toxin-antitoxin module